MSEVKLTSNVPTKTLRTEKYRESYANNSRLALTPVDMAIIFGRVTEVDKEAVVEDDYLVRMSPQAIKILAASISHLVTTWESQFGEIDISKMSRHPNEILSSIRSKLVESEVDHAPKE
jgi:hypothetical protein